MPVRSRPRVARLTRRVVLSLAALAAGAGLLAGCATQGAQRAAVQQALLRRDYAAALAELDRRDADPRDVLYLLDRGLLLHYLERYDESNAAFEAAEVRIQDLYTKSLSKQAVSLLTSDRAIPYDGAPFERALIPYYRMLNYLEEGQLEDALVECRKANLFLAMLAAKGEGQETAYQDDAFLQYLTALLYEDAGEWNDAWVSLRRAESAFARYAEAFGVPPPATLGGDLRRLSRELGYREEHEQYRERYPEACDTLPPGHGELVVLFENGLAPVKEEIDLTLPILKGERERYREAGALAQMLADRRAGYAYEETELDYLLRVAIPELRSRPPLVRTAEVEAGTAVATTMVVEDIAALSAAAHAEAMTRILVKTILRGLTKYLGTRWVEKEAGEIGGLLANLLTAASEQADTRGWITLPNDIQMARLALPAGEQTVRLRFLDADGVEVATGSVEGVVIRPGRRAYLAWREWE